MSTTTPTNETVSTDDAQPAELADRDVRALLTPMTVIDNCGDVRGVDGLFEVTTDSGSEYVVSLRSDECTCPDHKHRGVKCKHIRRCEFETGRRAIPGDVNLEALDDQLGEHVTEGEPRIAMTDGGMQALEGSTDTPQTDTDPRDNYILIGTDADGSDHVYRTTDETVHVVEDGARVWVQDLDPEDDDLNVNAWIQHIKDRRGFETQHLYQTAADALGGAL